ncbi:MAG: phosphotransferase [Proteobacteria bacterium]|nr:phosphotransferase [Pseudomonadota bacterium]
MKISELRLREDYDAILQETLKRVVGGEGKADQQWYEHPFFSVYVTRGFCQAGIQFLQEQYRHTPHRMRRIVQGMGVELFGLRSVFERMIRPAFKLPAIENASYCMWMPGNQRLRRFDFKNRVVSVYGKAEFSDDGLRREIDFRMAHSERHDWILPILTLGTHGFDEPLLDATGLDRVRNARNRQMGLNRALMALDALHQYENKEVTAAEYLEMKRAEFVHAEKQLQEKFMGISLEHVEKIWDLSSREVSQVQKVELSLTHGDFQPGNVLISNHDDRIWIIDWEDIGVRASIYDLMTWGLRSRFPRGLYNRVQSYLQTSQFDECRDITVHYNARVAVALWAIEEWIWLMQSSSRNGISEMNAGLVTHFKEICQI